MLSNRGDRVAEQGERLRANEITHVTVLIGRLLSSWKSGKKNTWFMKRSQEVNKRHKVYKFTLCVWCDIVSFFIHPMTSLKVVKCCHGYELVIHCSRFCAPDDVIIVHRLWAGLFSSVVFTSALIQSGRSRSVHLVRLIENSPVFRAHFSHAQPARWLKQPSWLQSCRRFLSMQHAAHPIPFSAHELRSCQKYNRQLK